MVKRLPSKMFILTVGIECAKTLLTKCCGGDGINLKHIHGATDGAGDGGCYKMRNRNLWIVISMILAIILGLLLSWGITIAFIYLIFWLLKITFSLRIATVIWLVLVLLSGGVTVTARR